MRFHLIDRIVELQAGRSLRATKLLTTGEEYLADHFPTFPVMPGVMMLQTLVEAGAWLLRLSSDYEHSVIVMREARNVKYGSFMEPGKQMHISVELVDDDGRLATFKGKGEAEGATTVSARIVLAHYNLRDHNQAWQEVDQRMVQEFRAHSRLLLASSGQRKSAPGI